MAIQRIFPNSGDEPEPLPTNVALPAVNQEGNPNPEFDLADRLPDAAKAKLKAWREQRDDNRILLHNTYDAWNELMVEKGKAASRTKTLERHVPQLPDDHPSLRQARENLKRATARFDELSQRRDARSHRFQELNRLVENAETWLKQLPAGLPIRASPPPAVSVEKGESHATGVARQRERIAQLRADLHEIRSAPITAREAAEIIRAEVEKLAERGTPNLYPVLDHAEGVRWPEVNVTSRIFGGPGHAAALINDSLALMAWIYKDELLARLGDEFDTIADDANALDRETRAARIAETKALILDTERAEAALVEQASGEILHRPEIDPRAALGVTGPEPKEQE